PLLSCCFGTRPLLTLTPFPYTPLFRSVHCDEAAGRTVRDPYRRRVRLEDAAKARFAGRKPLIGNLQGLEPRLHPSQLLLRPLERSEEHTSELQSRENLVCRLLLEKKKE